MYYDAPLKEHSPNRRELTQIARAIEVAKNSIHRCRHGSVIMKGSRITCGHNKVKNHPSISEHSASVHAEYDALREHSNPGGAICIVIRLDWKNDLQYSAPCMNCRDKLAEYGIKRIIFSDPNSSTGFSVLEL